MNDNEKSPLAEMTEGLMQLMEGNRVFLEFSEGVKADMEKRGWSPTLAEHTAFEYMRFFIRKMGDPLTHQLEKNE